MNEKSRKEGTILCIVMGIVVLGVALAAYIIQPKDDAWFLMMAVVYCVAVVLVIFKDNITEAYKPEAYKPEEIVDSDRMSPAYIGMDMREKFERCITDQKLCDSRDDCEGCPADIPDDVFEVLWAEKAIRDQLAIDRKEQDNNVVKMPEMQ